MTPFLEGVDLSFVDRIAHAENFLSRIVAPGRAFELRVKMAETDWRSGRYTDVHKMAIAAIAVQENNNAEAVYFGLNDLKPEARVGCTEPNKLQRHSRRGSAASDRDILARRTYLIDIDPVRPHGVMATSSEHQAAFQVAQAVHDYLAHLDANDNRPWPEPIWVDSGSGIHLLYRGDDVNPDSQYWRFVLQHLADKFNTDRAEVDTGVFNPAQLSRMPGSMNCKGPNSPERPHRMARVIRFPKKWEPLPHPKIYKLAVDNGFADAPCNSGFSAADRDLLIEDEGVRRLIDEFPTVLSLLGTEEDHGEVRYFLSECPFAGRRHRNDPRHTALILNRREGRFGFKCLSSDCASYHLSDLLLLCFAQTGRRSSVRIWGDIEITPEMYRMWGIDCGDEEDEEDEDDKEHDESEDWDKDPSPEDVQEDGESDLDADGRAPSAEQNTDSKIDITLWNVWLEVSERKYQSMSDRPEREAFWSWRINVNDVGDVDAMASWLGPDWLRHVEKIRLAEQPGHLKLTPWQIRAILTS